MKRLEKIMNSEFVEMDEGIWINRNHVTNIMSDEKLEKAYRERFMIYLEVGAEKYEYSYLTEKARNKVLDGLLKPPEDVIWPEIENLPETHETIKKFNNPA
jgi:hypothetical protein